MTVEALHREWVEGASRSAGARLARTLLMAGVPFWRLGLALDQRQKRARLRGTGRPTVSVGNLSAGGTGKTPATGWIVSHLLAGGHRPAVLTRGHGGRPGAPADEVLELRERLGPEVPVQPDPDRHAAAAAVLAARPDITCFVLDDGFQRRDVARELDLVLFDASRPLAAARLLPAGLLREPPAALARADAVLLTRVERASPEGLRAATAFVRRWHGRDPLARFAHQWVGVDRSQPDASATPPAPTHPLPLASLAGTRLHVAAGIGRPDAFADQLREAGVVVTGLAPMRDHHRFDAAGLATLHAAAAAAGAQGLATTRKDWVKWRNLPVGHGALPVWIPRLEFEARAGGDELRALLTEKLGRPDSPPESAP